MNPCWSRARAPLLERVAPSFCGGDGFSVDDVAVLVERPDARECLTDRLECDAESAACRGLAQYLAMSERPHRGRTMAFEAAVESWPDIEDHGGGMPALGVWRGEQNGQYDRSLSRHISPPTDQRPGHQLVTWTDLTLNLAVECWCSGPGKEERVGIRLLVEQSLMPFEWLNGVRLDLPFYGGRRVEYALVSGGFQDDPNLIAAGIRRVVFVVMAVVPVWRPVLIPEAKVSSSGTVMAPGSDLPRARGVVSVR